MSKTLFMVVKNLLGVVLLFIALLLGGSYWIMLNDDPVLFQSEESSSKMFGPIFNRISWKSFKDKDVWMMQQSQTGLNSNYDHWDRLVIVVDKTTSPKTAIFTQTSSSPFEFKEPYQNKEFRVACGLCHNNGPRAIRPMTLSDDSSALPLTWLDQIKVTLWNLRIKSYGRVISKTATHIDGMPRKIPFAFDDVYAQKNLQISNCVKCHNNSYWGRGELQRQHYTSIQFMVENGYMPPLGFNLFFNKTNFLKEFNKAFQPKPASTAQSQE